MQDKPQGTSLVSQAVECGEKLYPNTAAEGRETIRQQLRALKQDWDMLCDAVMGEQRQLELNLVQWTSFEESYEQLEAWLINMETQLNSELTFQATLEEKKAQLQTYKVGSW